MGLASQLMATLLCLLACTSNMAHVHRKTIVLREVIRTLNTLTERKDACLELTVADVFAAPKNTTRTELFCRAATVLRQFYKDHKCLYRFLRGLDKNLSSLANMTHCPVTEDRKSTLKSLLERLNTITKEKYFHSSS
ncbi:interleukin-4 [Sorex araneus]|uniref:interleukin-4 n=1 Tax=Sorex araneus TaxID=42254 RepID=UPI0003318B46|nr:interleukin-4 [Sorex araneus]